MKRLVVAIVIAIACTRSVGQMVHMHGRSDRETTQGLTAADHRDVPVANKLLGEQPLSNVSREQLLEL